jgi:outer membrane protein OmpA-like peptidoglycan-associated protein
MQAAPPRPSLSLSIAFDFDSARIRPQSLVVLGNLAAALASPALLASPFVIEGHTDAKGAADYNRKLSAQRAQAVKDLLVAKGIDAARLVSVGKGSSELANASAPLAAENRRVKIVNQD